MSSPDPKITVKGFGQVSLAELEDIMAVHALADRLNEMLELDDRLVKCPCCGTPHNLKSGEFDAS